MTVTGHDALATSNGKPRPKLVFFSSATSGRARRVEGFLAQVLQRRKNHQTFDVVNVDIDTHPELVERFAVTRPAELVVVEGKRIQARIAEPRGCSEIADLLSPWLR